MSEVDPADTKGAGVLAALTKMGWTPEGVAPEAVAVDEDPMAALNMENHDDIVRIPIPEDSLADLAPPEKERQLRGNDGPPAEVNPWIRRDAKLGTVGVSQEEKEAYQKALLLEDRFQIPIEVPLMDQTVTVMVRSLYASEREVIALAIDAVTKSYPVKTLNDTAVLVTHYFRAAVLTQVVSIDDKPCELFDARIERDQLSEDSPKVAELARLTRTRFQETHQAKFKMLIRALEIFELKQVILEDAVGNRDFYRPADAS